MLTLPATRLLVPARPAKERLLERGRLLSVLSERPRKLMLLVAPAGFGKTTLALDYVATSNLLQMSEAAAWLSLDLGGIMKWDTRLFLHALTVAIKNALPGLNLSEIERELSQLSAGSELSEELSANLVFGISNILAQQSRPVLLVIDDYHLVCDERSVRDARLINDIVNTLLITAPEHLRLLIASRVYPALDVLKLSTEDQVVVVNKAQLKFTKSEIAAFLSLRGKDIGLTEQVALESEGWPAAVALKLQNLDLDANLLEQLPAGNLGASSRYKALVEEMLKQLEPPLRRLLEACSVLDLGINIEMARQLVSCYRQVEAPEEPVPLVTAEQVAAQLKRLESFGLVERFNSVAPGGESELPPITLYRYHNLLKEYLEKNLSEQVVKTLNSTACAYYRETGDWALAFEHALKAGNHSDAAEILEERAYEQFKTSNVSEIAQRVQRLEESTLQKHPHLLQVAGMASFTAGQMEKAMAYLELANRRWGHYEPIDNLIYPGTEPLTPGLLVKVPENMDSLRLLNKAETVICIGKLMEVTGRIQHALSILEGIQEVLKELPNDDLQLEDRRLYILALANRHLGNSYRLLGRFNESIEKLTNAINIFMRLGDGYNVAGSRQNLGIAWRQLGNQARAELNFRQAREYWERHGTPKELSTTLNSLAVGLINQGRFKEAIDLLLEALEKAREAGHEYVTMYILAGLGDAYLGARDKAKALSYYAQAGAEAGRQNSFEMLTYAKLGAARALRRAGEPAQARQAVLAALDYAEESTDRDRAAAAVENGAYQAIYSRQELAQAQLEGALSLAHKVQARQTEAAAHFWLAYLHYRVGRYKLAYDNMRRAIALAQELGYDAFLHEEAVEVPDFAEHFRANPNDPVGAFFSPNEETALNSGMVIEMRAFGRARIMRGGQEVPSVSRKARELIFLLLEQKVPVNSDRILENLWQTTLAGNGQGSGFYSTVTHARRALGSSDTIRANDGSYSLNVRYRYDVEQFEELLNRATRTTEVETKIELLEIALDLFSGEFLADTDSDWAANRRRELDQKKIKALNMLANAYQSQGNREKALEILIQLMNLEPYDEQIIRSYTQILAETRSKTIALNFLRKRIDFLLEEEIEPEEKTYQFIEELDSSRSISKRRKPYGKLAI
ncbi:MAG TPA: tetratricopeptide repeat protein [Chloroflexia bacterium]|nr:tetratricopeptide repeat protein [Chloroflexia bacterium]